MVRATRKIHAKTGVTLAGLALFCTLLAGCSGRDTETAEKLAAMEQLVLRAEKAAERAEAAAKKAGAQPAAVIEAEPEDPSLAEASQAEEGDGSEPTTR